MFRQAQKAAQRRSTDAGGAPRRSLRVLICGTAVAASVLCAASPVLATPRPPNPSDAQLNAARDAKASLANTVGRLSGQIVQAQAALRSLSAQAELAEQKFAFAMFKLNQAKDQAAQAQSAVAAAQKGIETARANLTSYVRDSYMSPTVGSATVGLLSAKDPSALLQGGDYRNYVSSRHLDAMSSLDRATVAKSNADARARSLVVLQQQLTAAAADAQRAAQRAYANEKAQAAQLHAQEASFQRQLVAAQTELATLNGQRARFIAYQQEQARIAAERARQAALARARAAAAAAAAAQAAREEQQRQQQQQQQQSSGGGNSGGSSSSGGGQSLPPSGSMGGWSAGAGQSAANRALGQLGVPYAWDGGSYYGRTRGVDSPGTDGAHDSQVIGFDCSGLTMFAWAGQGLYLDHYAASQYYSGSFHPQPGQFMPGDLLFWSDGGAGAIHHVALYIGGGNVVQAPNSGDVVKVTPWDQVAYGYFGATRPLT